MPNKNLGALEGARVMRPPTTTHTSRTPGTRVSHVFRWNEESKMTQLVDRAVSSRFSAAYPSSTTPNWSCGANSSSPRASSHVDIGRVQAGKADVREGRQDPNLFGR